MKLRLLRTLTIPVFIAALISVTATKHSLSQSGSDTRPLDGFSDSASVTPGALQAQFGAVPAPSWAREHLRRLTAEPHIAGTKEDYATAVYVRDQLRSYGLSAELKEYEVWLNYPKSPTLLELITNSRQKL